MVCFGALIDTSSVVFSTFQREPYLISCFIPLSGIYLLLMA